MRFFARFDTFMALTADIGDKWVDVTIKIFQV